MKIEKFKVLLYLKKGGRPSTGKVRKLSHQRGFHETHVYVVDLLRRLKAILGEYRQASYKPKPSSMGRKEDTTAQLRDWSRKSMSFLPPQRTQERKPFQQVMT